MAKQQFILFPSDAATWRIGVIHGRGEPRVIDVALDEGRAPASIAGVVRRSLDRLGYRRQGILLAIPSAWCLAATIDLSGLDARENRAMLFRLEEQLPLAAEEVVADFIVRSERAMGVAARVRELQPLVDALEAAGIAIESIAPAALLAAQNSRAGGAIMLINEGPGVNVLAMRDGKAVHWSLVADDPAAIDRETAIAATKFDAPPSITRSKDLYVDASDPAARVLDGVERPAIELRRGALASSDRLRQIRRPVNIALVAATIALFILAGAMLLRGEKYDRRAAELDRQLMAEFQRVFPSWSPPPANVRAVIDSEYRRATAATPPGKAPANTSALRLMFDVLSKLPADTKCSIDRISFGDGTFDLTARAKSLEQAEQLATAARSAGLDVPPAQSRRDPSGAFWTITLRGTRPQVVAAITGPTP